MTHCDQILAKLEDHLDGRLVVDHEGTISYPKDKKAFFDKLFK